jgi:SIT4-associating protein SAP185/190
MPTLLSFLGPEHSWATQTAAGDFIKAIITVSANASQNEQACIGPNELTRQLVSRPCVEKIIGYMLGGGNPLTVGVGIVIEVIRKNNSDYDPDVGVDALAQPSSRDPIYLGTLLRLFAEHVPDFMSLILNAPAQKQRLDSTFGDKIEPLGFDRFKTCELMAELLHCSNMALLNEVGSEQLIAQRDEDRRRLRLDGRLTATRTEEVQSSEDLTMRSRHSSPDDNRRLEVTNASDDDGFEEVAPSGEMTEDTSHEFVKAEDEIPVIGSASFLDKDDDDFVDEPLSSPRLNVHEPNSDEHQFEIPELVVAPLSPKKQTRKEPEPESAPSPPLQPEDKADRDAASSAATNTTQTNNPIRQDGVQTSMVETSPEKATAEEPSTLLKENCKQDDTPEVDTEPASEHQVAEAPKPDQISSNEQETKAELPTKNQRAPSDNPTSDSTAQTIPGPSDAVVGDFLKMQFVENNVVPTILVISPYLLEAFQLEYELTSPSSHSFSDTPGTTSSTT